MNGNLVLAGVTGSGKSILMDLLMLVLVGPEKARHHFNRSATGTQSDRTLKGYCLLDTKREALEAAVQLELLTGVSMPLSRATPRKEGK